MGFPVRRPFNSHIIIAVAEEIDQWVQGHSSVDLAADEILKRNKLLETENEQLRHTVADLLAVNLTGEVSSSGNRKPRLNTPDRKTQGRVA
jgi:hypothetical protein